MAARIEVNAGTVRAYLDRAMTRENYHLMYGLHLLSKDRFRGIMDALINGDLQPEDLVRLGSFSDDEADVLLSESLSGWTSGSVATPTAGTDGYQYLTRTLGVDAADPDTLAVGIAPRRAFFRSSSGVAAAEDRIMTRLAFVLIEGFADWEPALLAALARESFGAEVVFAAPGGRAVISIGGLEARPTAALESLRVDDVIMEFE